MLQLGDLTLDVSDNDAIVSIEGLETPEVRTNDIDRPLTHGQFMGFDYMSGRTITVQFEIIGDDKDDYKTRIRKVEKELVPGKDTTMVWTDAFDEVRRAKVRIRRRNMKTDQNYFNGFATYTVELRSSDPRLYGDQVDASVAQFQTTTSGGLRFGGTTPQFPLTFTVGSTLAGSITLSNNGNFETPTVVRMYGPVVNPRITNVTDGKFLQVNTTLSTTADWVEVDMDAKTILSSTGSSLYGFKTDSSEWFGLKPGETVVTYTSTSSTGSPKMLVSYSHAWV